MISFVIRLFSNSLALWVAYLLVPGLVVTEGVTGFIIAGLALGILNVTVRPIIKFVATPLIILTLGIFVLVINALMLWLISYFLSFVEFQSLGALVWTTLVVSLANILISATSKAFKSLF